MNPKLLRCINCDCEMPPFIKPKLYCSIACEQEAELIRYCRRCIKDGRLNDTDVMFAIRTRLAHIMSGGYNKKARFLSRETREAVLRRSKGKCETCGKDGSDIDHIRGSSSDLSNLQYLCKSCHNVKTEKSIVSVEPGSEEYEFVKARTEQFWQFVKSNKPMRICHDENEWKSVWRTYVKERKAYALDL